MNEVTLSSDSSLIFKTNLMSNIAPAIIRTYLAVVETGSLTLASKRIGLTIGAISYQISHLERLVGEELFIRKGRGMQLSQKGQQFLPQARLLLKVCHQVMQTTPSPSPSDLSESFSTKNTSGQDTSNPSNIKCVNLLSTFEDNLETEFLKNIFSMWQSYRNDGKDLSLDDLVKKGLISLVKDNVILAHFEQSDLRVIGASEEPTKLFELDKNGYGISADQMWNSPQIFESRRKIFSICRDTNVPVFYAGNAPIAWHLDSYASTIDRFSKTRLDRLLLPVKTKSKVGNHWTILQIAEFRYQFKPPFQKRRGLSEEEQAANLNFIGNVAVAL